VIIADSSRPELRKLLASNGLGISIGPFRCCIKTKLASVCDHLYELYPDTEIDIDSQFTDFPVEVERAPGLRRWLKPLAEFTFNGNVPFTPLALDQAPALLEWGINWCVSAHAHHLLVIHSSVVEKNGRAIIMPAPSGSGKSTLCAGLVARGWRLLSDELTLIRVSDGQILPIPKPISLKNESIEIISEFWPEAIVGKVCKDTLKGRVAHFRPPAESVRNANIPAVPAFVIFPRYAPSVECNLIPKEKGHAFMLMVENAFNYHLLGVEGFDVLKSVIDKVEVFDFEYSSLDRAIDEFEHLVK